MNRCIDAAHAWLNGHPRARQWLWFAALWLGGLLTVTALSYPLKWAVQSI